MIHVINLFESYKTEVDKGLNFNHAGAPNCAGMANLKLELLFMYTQLLFIKSTLADQGFFRNQARTLITAVAQKDPSQFVF